MAGSTADAGLDGSTDSSGAGGNDGTAGTRGMDHSDARVDTGTSGTDAGDASVGPDASSGCSEARDAYVLVLFDQSASMDQQWTTSAGATSKLNGAKDAVRAAVAAQPDTLRAGVLFFPTAACVAFQPPPTGGAVAAFEGSPQISFRPAAQFITAWDAKWAGSRSLDNIGTPVQEAFDRADLALATADSSAPQAVVLITDGEGNCFSDETIGIPFDTVVNRATAWASRGVATHVVSLPTSGSGATEPMAIARAAGTQLILPDGATALERTLNAILLDLTCGP